MDVERIANNKLKYYWQPNSGVIEPAKTYEHTFTAEFLLNCQAEFKYLLL